MQSTMTRMTKALVMAKMDADTAVIIFFSPCARVCVWACVCARVRVCACVMCVCVRERERENAVNSRYVCVQEREAQRRSERGREEDADTAVIIFFSPCIYKYIYITRTADDSDSV